MPSTGSFRRFLSNEVNEQGRKSDATTLISAICVMLIVL